MNNFQINMESLKMNRPSLYDAVNNYKNESTTLQISTQETISNEQALFVQTKDKSYRVNSIYSPSFEADVWADQFKVQELNNHILMFGLGNGVFLRSIMKRLQAGDLVLVYEPSPEILVHVLNNYDLTDIIENEHIVIAVEEMNSKEFHFSLFEVMNVTNLKSIIICNHPFYNEIFEQEYVVFWREIRDSYTSAIMNVNTEVLFGEKFVDNILKNLIYIKDSNSITDIKEIIPDGLPAVIVAAGPSVEQNIEELKHIKGKAVIFAVDRILDFLLDSGIEPDFVVTIDPDKPIEYFSKRDNIAIPLILFMQANHDVLNVHKGRKIICNSSSFLGEAYKRNHKEVPAIYSSASVATVTFTACIELGFRTIILVGQDLAYKGTVSHAGSVEENYGDEQDVMVEGISGNMIKSRYDWKHFIIWYQDVIATYKNLTVIDAKKEGAKIIGTTVMPLEEAVEKYGKGNIDIAGLVETLQPTFNQDEITNIREYLKENLKDVDMLTKKAQKAIRHCDFLIDAYQSKKSTTNQLNDKIRSVTGINVEISNHVLYSLLDKYIMSSAVQEISTLYHFTGDTITDNIKTYERAKGVFQTIVEGLEYIKPRLEEAENQLN